MNYVRIINGVVIAHMSAEGYAATDESVRGLWKTAPDDVRAGWRKVNGVWTAPPDQPAPAPVSFYLPKVTFERRFSDRAFIALDQLRIRIRSRPADWATTEVEPWFALRSFVRPVADYEAAERINVLDASLPGLLAAIQVLDPVFGESEEAAQAEIARILTPGLLPGEPAL